MAFGRARRVTMIRTGLLALLGAGLVSPGLMSRGANAEQAEAAPAAPPALITVGATSMKPTISPECANRTDVLGVSRVVEIDTAAGPHFGEQYTGLEDDFLNFGEVVITFDDGPSRRNTMTVLEALDEQCTKATFFSVGRMAAADPETLQEVARRGHTIGTHTWSHKNLATLSAAGMKREVELGISAVAAAVDAPIAPFFRFPYLGHSKSSRAYLQSRGIGIFGIHVDSKDFRTRNAATMQRTLLNRLESTGKGILLFHDIQLSTARGIKGLLAELKSRGFRVVHIVPKTPQTTLPEFDAIAAKSIKRRKDQTAKTPLANRAVTWPAGDDEPATAATPPSAVTPAQVQTKPKPSGSGRDWSNPTGDFWQLQTMGD